MVWERKRTLLHCCYEVCTAVTCTRRRSERVHRWLRRSKFVVRKSSFLYKCVSTFIDAFLHFFVSWQRRSSVSSPSNTVGVLVCVHAPTSRAAAEAGHALQPATPRSIQLPPAQAHGRAGKCSKGLTLRLS